MRWVWRRTLWLGLLVSVGIGMSGCDFLGLASKTIEVEGRVLELRSGEPIADIAVGIYGRNGCVRLGDPTCSTRLELTFTDEEGNFQLKHEPTGDFAFIFIFVNPDDMRNFEYGQEVELLQEGKKLRRTYLLAKRDTTGGTGQE